MSTLIELETALKDAADAVLAIQDRLDDGQSIDPAEYDQALVPFTYYLEQAKDKRDRFAEFLLRLAHEALWHRGLAEKDIRKAKAIEKLIIEL